jgi:hypothetical protein
MQREYFSVSHQTDRVRVTPSSYSSSEILCQSLGKYFDLLDSADVVGFERNGVLYPPSVMIKFPTLIHTKVFNLVLLEKNHHQ